MLERDQIKTFWEAGLFPTFIDKYKAITLIMELTNVDNDSG